MPEEIDQDQMNKLMFMNLIMMLSTTVMQQLGKIANPMNGKIESDLQGAQATIDMLAMLDVKTNGNRDDEEERLMKQTLSACQMNYVETSKSAPAEEPAEEAAPEGAEEAAAEETPAEDAPAEAGADSKDPKFHKSYEEE